MRGDHRPATAGERSSWPEDLRERIAMVRVLCIGLMIYVHVPDNAFSDVAGSGVPLPSIAVQGFLVEGVGRASAALLSLVSGLLTGVALGHGTPGALYRRRCRSIVVPMIIWSTATVVLYALISLAQPTFLQRSGDTVEERLLFYSNAVFFLTEQPIGPTLHLGFLRDLFVSILLAPVLLALIRRIGAVVPLLLGVLYLLDVESVVMLRPLVLFAFSLGLWLVVRSSRLDAVDAAWPLWIALSVLATLAVLASGTERGLASVPAAWFAAHGLDIREVVFYPASRLFGGLAIWSVSSLLVGTAAGGRLVQLSPYVFVAFCSHFLVLTVLWEGAVRPVVGSSATVGYALWFGLAPLAAMGGAALIVEAFARVSPPLARLLTGGRAARVAPRTQTASAQGDREASTGRALPDRTRFERPSRAVIDPIRTAEMAERSGAKHAPATTPAE